MDGQMQRLALAISFERNSSLLGRLLREHESIDRLWREPALLQPYRRRLSPVPPAGELDARLRALREQGWSLRALGDPDYPSLLAELADAPGILFVRGDPDCLRAPQLAMVGARGASPEGLGHARRFARALAGAGFVVTSGLARGVDAAAHEGALEAGRSVAVLPAGPDRIYPATHAKLADRLVAAGGALVTEFPPGIRPLRASFPQRNRIISGLSLGTIVVEAALRSGSLITARLAAEQGREVFAVPGSLNNPMSRGCHRLLRDGANWLESLDDIQQVFPALALLAEGAGDGDAAREPTARHPLLAHFVAGVNTPDQLAERSGLPAAELAGTLTELELDGSIVRIPGGYSLAGGSGFNRTP